MANVYIQIRGILFAVGYTTSAVGREKKVIAGIAAAAAAAVVV